MRNQINLSESWRFYVPTVRLYGNVVLQQCSRLGAPIDFPLLLPLAALQATVHRARAHGQQLLLQQPTQPVAFADPRHPTRQQRLQPSNRVLAVVTCGYAELVEQCRSRLPFRLVVSLVHHPEVLPLRLVSQTQLSPGNFCGWSWVTSYVSRQPPLGLHFAWRDSRI